MPQLNNIFQVNAATVEFKSDPSVTDAKMDFVGVPDNVDGDAAEFGGAVGSFKEWLRQMIRWSNNLAASKCIDALGYFYINGLLRSAGVFVPDAVIPRTGEGLWISADYEKHDWVSNADDKLETPPVRANYTLGQRSAPGQEQLDCKRLPDHQADGDDGH